MDKLLGFKKLWHGVTIKVLRVLEGPDNWGLIRIQYKMKYGKIVYTLWVYPTDLTDVNKKGE